MPSLCYYRNQFSHVLTVEPWEEDVTISWRALTESACSNTNTHTDISGGMSCNQTISDSVMC